MRTLKVNPELLSNKATHIYNGVKVKVFTRNGEYNTTAEIMEGPDKGKWTTVELNKIVKIG